MMHSVVKNLLIEKQITKTLMFDHIPFLLLCVSHTCEVFDKANMFVLCETERRIGLRELPISHIAMLRSFLSKAQSVSFAALTAFTKLAINDGHKFLVNE